MNKINEYLVLILLNNYVIALNFENHTILQFIQNNYMYFITFIILISSIPIINRNIGGLSLAGTFFFVYIMYTLDTKSVESKNKSDDELTTTTKKEENLVEIELSKTKDDNDNTITIFNVRNMFILAMILYFLIMINTSKKVKLKKKN